MVKIKVNFSNHFSVHDFSTLPTCHNSQTTNPLSSQLNVPPKSRERDAISRNCSSILESSFTIPISKFAAANEISGALSFAATQRTRFRRGSLQYRFFETRQLSNRSRSSHKCDFDAATHFYCFSLRPGV